VVRRVSTTPTAVGEPDLLDIILMLKRERNLARAGWTRHKEEKDSIQPDGFFGGTTEIIMFWVYSLNAGGNK
jgi:hypothetical protein